MSTYAELHCLSNFTFLRGASHPGELVAQAAAHGYAALALTDECSMAGVVRAHDEAKKHRIKLIVGAEFRTLDDLQIVLLAPTRAAYAEICALITRARLAAAKGEYRLTRADFQSGLGNCLALWVPAADPRASTAAWLRERFSGRCWIAVEIHLGADDARRLAQLRQLGVTHGLPLVAAGDVHMHSPERRALQDTLTAIRHRCTLAAAGHHLFPNGERHLRSCEQLVRLYPRELLEETLRVAARCEFSLHELRYQYPRELVPEGMEASQHLRNLTEAGMKMRWPNGVPEKLRETIEKELRLIRQLGYEHFFLTVHELVQWARNRPKPILCQGRGSAANSVVCYALRITEVDPDKIAALFERFISAERNEPPDIDVDFEHERREEVIQHVFEKYGRERAALAATVITYRPKSAIRDVGKALGLDTDVIDRLAKAQAYWDDWETFRHSVARQGLYLDADVIQRLCALVKELLNFPRHLSQHVGGFVIAQQRVADLVPIENAAMPERQVIQWDKNDLESLGLLKVDVLALGMLTALQRTFDLLGTAGAGPTKMEQIPREDAQTYDMICRADTIGVFQIESRAQMSMLPRLRPRTYYDLVIEIAIVRPGPIKGGMVHPYLERRHLRPEQVSYPSEDLRPVLEKTRGVPIFQEQVMQIAVVAAGFSPGEADELRRAMGAWQRSGNMGTYQRKLMDGMRAKGYSEKFAEQIYQQIEGFGEYGFPESHSASFALLTYVSSYLKLHHPAAFFAGLINSQPMGFYQPAQLLEQAKRQQVEILPVDVTVSDYQCTLERAARAIRLGMRLVKGLRREEAQRIVAARAERAFVSMADVTERAMLSTRAARALATCGAFRSLTEHRNIAFWNALAITRAAQLSVTTPASEESPVLPAPTEWEEILRDYHQLGLSTGRHPLALLRPRLRSLGVLRRRDLESIESGCEVCVSGLVTHLQHPQTAKGVIFASLEDETGINNIIFWPDVFEMQRHRVIGTTLLVVFGELQNEQGVIHVVARHVEDYTHWVRRLPRKSRDFH
ncbi:MAG TPA: error-prone DNA polymerase [Steroidobacteraceae bacterium]|nr:error-prone DNA polymerase [Steroidobacteraceae bacterium]